MTAHRPSLANRFQGTLLGVALAADFSISADKRSPLNPEQMAWWAAARAIAQHLIEGSPAAVTATSQSQQQLAQTKPSETATEYLVETSPTMATPWSRGLEVLPLMLARSDWLYRWRHYKTLVSRYEEAIALPSDASTSADLYSLPYALVPQTLSALLHPSVLSQPCESILTTLIASLIDGHPDKPTEPLTAFCLELLQCLQQVLESVQGMSTLLPALSQVTHKATVKSQRSSSQLVSDSHLADGVLIALMLYCLLTTPAEFDVALTRFCRGLSHPEMTRFEDMQPYIKSVQRFAIATLGGLLGAQGGRLRLPQMGVQSLVKFNEDLQSSTLQPVAGEIYAELIVWGTRLWAFWSGATPTVCLQFQTSPVMHSNTNLNPTLSHQLAAGVTASPNLIRVFGD